MASPHVPRRPSWQYLMPALWRPTGDPSAHAQVAVDAKPLLDLLDEVQRAGHRLQPTAVVLKAVGMAMVEEPAINVSLRWGRVVPRDRVDAWVTLADEDGNLYGKRIDRLDERDVLSIQRELDAEAERHRDPAKHGKRNSGAPLWLRFLPRWLLALVFKVAGLWIHDLRLPVPGYIGRDGFGTVHVTSVGSQGLRWADAPIPPITRQPFLMVVGAIHEAPVARGGQVVAAPILPVSATVDHRMMVGGTINRYREAFEAALQDPETLASYLPDPLPTPDPTAVATPEG